MTPLPFELQGHRGARGLKPENTLPSFEVALDVGVTSVETDIHLTCDRVPVLFHDSLVSERLCRPVPGGSAPDLVAPSPVSSLSLAQLRLCRADRNPDPRRFPEQEATVTPLAQLFAEEQEIDPFTPPTLADLFMLCAAYCGPVGRQVGKTEAQQSRADRVRFDLELKRVPFRPALIGDDYDGQAPALLERLIVDLVRKAGLVQRTRIRSFDHRCVRAVRQLEPGLETAVLVAGTTPIAPADLASRAGAQLYCPDVEFLDETQVREAHSHGIRVIPWTVNHAEDWMRLLDWGVDGITTDFPDRLAALLRQRGRTW